MLFAMGFPLGFLRTLGQSTVKKSASVWIPPCGEVRFTHLFGSGAGISRRFSLQYHGHQRAHD